MQLLLKLLYVRGVVLHDVVERDLELGPQKLHFDILASGLEILTLFTDLLHKIELELEARHGSDAHEVGVTDVSQHEGSMVDDSSTAKALDDELFVFDAFIVLN